MESLHWSESKPILYCYVREVEKTSSIWIQNSKTRSHGQSDRNRLENGFWITAYEFCRILLHSPLCMALKILLKIFVFWISSRIACDYQSGVKSIWSVFICYICLKIFWKISISISKIHHVGKVLKSHHLGWFDCIWTFACDHYDESDMATFTIETNANNGWHVLSSNMECSLSRHHCL